MIQASTLLKVVDKTGITSVKCIKVLSTIKSRIAFIGDIVIVAVHRLNPRKFKNVKLFKKKKFLKIGVLCVGCLKLVASKNRNLIFHNRIWFLF